jgi:transposase InsO family protein
MSRRWGLISAHLGEFGVQRLCRVLRVSRSGYYRWIAGADARAVRQAADDALAAEIRGIHTESGETYGVLRVHADLQGSGHHVNRKRVARLMREHGVAGRHLRRKKRTTVPDLVAPAVPDPRGGTRRSHRRGTPARPGRTPLRVIGHHRRSHHPHRGTGPSAALHPAPSASPDRPRTATSPDRKGTANSRTGRRRLHQPAHRRATGPEQTHCRHPSVQHLPQARRSGLPQHAGKR